MPSIIYFRRKRRRDPGSVAPESRLWWLLFMAPLETIGLFGFAWTSLGPSHGIPWIAPMIFSTLIAMANVISPLPFILSPSNFSLVSLSSRSANAAPVRNLPILNRLPNRRVWALRGFRNRRQRSRTRLPRRHRSLVLYAAVHEYRKAPAAVCVDAAGVLGVCRYDTDLCRVLEVSAD